jgi:N-acetylneuraminic acid mutarotase
MTDKVKVNDVIKSFDFMGRDDTVKVYENGDQEWYLNGKRYRENGPAVIYADGTQVWYINGELTPRRWPCYNLGKWLSDVAFKWRTYTAKITLLLSGLMATIRRGG